MASRIMSPRRQRMSERCDKTAAADDADCPHSFDQPTTSFLFAAKCREDQDAFLHQIRRQRDRLLPKFEEKDRAEDFER